MNMPTRRARTTRKENQSLKEILGLLDLPVSHSNEGTICQVCHACKSALSSYHANIEEVHPEYAENDFYITGESYAGHYIPAFASRVHRGNKVKEGLHINLKPISRRSHFFCGAEQGLNLKINTCKFNTKQINKGASEAWRSIFYIVLL